MWRLKCCRMWTEDNTIVICWVCTNLLDKEDFWRVAMIHQTVDLLMKRYCRADLGWSSEDFHVSWVRWGWVRVPRLDEGCLKLLVPFRMACHALNASWDIGLTNYNHDRRPSTGSSPSATTGRSDEASRYPSDVTAQSRQCQINTLTHDVHIYI